MSNEEKEKEKEEEKEKAKGNSLTSAFITGIGGVAATLLVTAATGWLQFRPTPAAVALRPDSFQLERVERIDTSIGTNNDGEIEEPSYEALIHASVVYEKSGCFASSGCSLEVTTRPHGNKFFAEIYQGRDKSGEKRGEYSLSIDMEKGVHQRTLRLIIKLTPDVSPQAIASFDMILDCGNAVSIKQNYVFDVAYCDLPEIFCPLEQPILERE